MNLDHIDYEHKSKYKKKRIKKYFCRKTGIHRDRSVVRANNCDDSSDGVVVNESSRKLVSSRNAKEKHNIINKNLISQNLQS